MATRTSRAKSQRIQSLQKSIEAALAALDRGDHERAAFILAGALDHAWRPLNPSPPRGKSESQGRKLVVHIKPGSPMRGELIEGETESGGQRDGR